MLDQDWLDKLLVITKRREEALKRLSEKPELYAYAMGLAEAFASSLNVLCNYATVTDGNGASRPVDEVIAEVQDDMHREFFRLTGRCYDPAVTHGLPKRGDNEAEIAKQIIDMACATARLKPGSREWQVGVRDFSAKAIDLAEMILQFGEKGTQ